MLYYLYERFADDYQIFNLFRYLTFRTGGAVMTSLLISFLFGPSLIRWMRRKQGRGQPIRQDGPQGHIIEKAGTPTMGGVLILLSMSIAILLWAQLNNTYVQVVLGVTLAFGLLGFLDDYLKVTRQNSGGVPGSLKLLFQFVVAISAGFIMMTQLGADAEALRAKAALAQSLGERPPVVPPLGIESGVPVPVFKELIIPLGIMFPLFVGVVIVGASNTVNLTDGLDGLATVPVMIAAATYALIAYLVGNAIFAGYLGVPYVPGAGEMAVICGAIIGAGLGFLWFNAPPAAIFMGDTGSLALGGAIGAIAVAAKHEIVLAIVGGLFVLEGLSVMIQIASFKLFGKRVFRMAPIHHHFEHLGWKESTIVIRFWIIAVILALIGLATLKLR